MAEFVEGWLVAQVLGEGAYGEVRLLVHARTGAAVALKVARGGEGAREAALQRALRHPHVLRCLGERTHLDHHYMFLEYAQGGELFDKIEPDVGMPEASARRYWRQALSGLQYLHARGVAHRDIKPENLLLDHHDHVKISDFGLATVFRHGARERTLTRVCGTLPYAAPEVLAAAARPYRAPPADLWAAALVLLAMLAGELPWERAAEEDARFAAWSAWQRGGGAVAGPWRKLCRGALSLLRAALRPAAAARPALDAMLSHPWTSEHQLAEGAEEAGDAREWRSQPAGAEAGDARDLTLADMDALLTHSQPARDHDLVLTGSEPAPPALAQRLVRRLTRVWLRCDEAGALRALRAALHERGHTWRELHPRVLSVECGSVRMRAWAVRCAAGGEARSLLEFRRSRGCGLQFKRRFLELRGALAPLGAAAPADAELLATPLAEPLLGPPGAAMLPLSAA